MKLFPSLLEASRAFDDFRKQVIDGNLHYVLGYLAQEDCLLVDPLENAVDDEDALSRSHSLLYEAVPHFDILDAFLKNPRFNPNDNQYEAFYRCLNFGLIEQLNLFFAHAEFLCPKNTLQKAAELGGKDLINFLLPLKNKEGLPLFNEIAIQSAMKICAQYNDTEIAEIMARGTP